MIRRGRKLFSRADCTVAILHRLRAEVHFFRFCPNGALAGLALFNA
jgi:hypothetical protein